MVRRVLILAGVFWLMLLVASVIGRFMLPPPLTVAYVGQCDARGMGTCIVDMRIGQVTQWSSMWLPTSDWLPDTPQVIYSERYPGEIHLSNGMETTVLMKDDQHNSTARWSPDGSKITYLKQPNANEHDIYVMNADGTESRPLYTDFSIAGSAPVWSPDNTRIAHFTRLDDNETEIWLLNINNDESIQIGSTRGNDVSFSPDGSQLVHSGSGGRVHAIVDVQTGNVITERDVVNDPDFSFGVSWSPDGERIAYIYRDTTQQREYVEVFHLATEETTRITQEPNLMLHDPVWTDENTLIQSVYTLQGGIIHMMDLQGNSLKTIQTGQIQNFIGVVTW